MLIIIQMRPTWLLHLITFMDTVLRVVCKSSTFPILPAWHSVWQQPASQYNNHHPRVISQSQPHIWDLKMSSLMCTCWHQSIKMGGSTSWISMARSFSVDNDGKSWERCWPHFEREGGDGSPWSFLWLPVQRFSVMMLLYIEEPLLKERCNDGDLEINSPTSSSAIDTEGFGS